MLLLCRVADSSVRRLSIRLRVRSFVLVLASACVEICGLSSPNRFADAHLVCGVMFLLSAGERPQR